MKVTANIEDAGRYFAELLQLVNTTKKMPMLSAKEERPYTQMAYNLAEEIKNCLWLDSVWEGTTPNEDRLLEETASALARTLTRVAEMVDELEYRKYQKKYFSK